MEDSYTVHRRRKAAARRRDRTPESRVPTKEAEDESKKAEDTRMRMEQMVEDTEKLEENIHDGRAKSPRPQSTSIPKEIQSESKNDGNNPAKPSKTVLISKETQPESKTEENNSAKSSKSVSIPKEIQLESKTEENISAKSSKSVSIPKEIQPESETEENNSANTPDIQSESKVDVKTVENSPNTQEQVDVNRISRPVRSSKSGKRRSKREKYKSSSDSSIAEDDDKSDSSGKRKELKQHPANKKQIIPIDNKSLIEDLKRFQKQLESRQIGILDHDVDDQLLVKPEVRRRKKSRAKEVESSEIKPKEEEKPQSKFWSWISGFRSVKVTDKIQEKVKEEKFEAGKSTVLEIRREFRVFVNENPREVELLMKWKNRCFAELILMVIFCGLGGFVFRFTEGAFENFYKCGVKRVKRDFLDSLWNYSHNLREEDWKSMARRKLMDFEEQLHTAHEAGVHSYSGQKSWTFLNSFVYCLTVVTTIGYGHISPSTTTGRAITIVYAIFGIPMFLIILADFGKLFTRGIKFLWAFVRRLYYTGSCRKVRKTARVQEVMKGVQLVYDIATFRRPSQMTPEDIEEMKKQQTILNLDANTPVPPPETPATPALSAFAIDDEFNLPISVAITILLIYIFVGATFFNLWENWGFFESFYFVFISMSTIGFGDYVPKHPIYMMCSIVYLVFGLALTSMCINVVQVMLSDSFKHATQKIGATIGFEVAEEDGSIDQAGDGGSVPPPVEVAEIHTTIPEENDDQHLKIPKDIK